MTPRIPLSALVAGAALLLPVAACSKDERISALEERVQKLEGEVRTLQSAAAPPSASASPAPDPKATCAKAKVAAHDAWESAEAGPKKQLEKARAAHSAAESNCTPSYATHCVTARLAAEKPVRAANARLATVVAAKKATSSGALKLRDAARAVKDDPDDPAIAAAKKASDQAFDACKTVDP